MLIAVQVGKEPMDFFLNSLNFWKVMANQIEPLWRDEPKDEEYQAVESYLNLIFESKKVKKLLKEFKKAPLVKFKSRDILRASHLPLLETTDYHVKEDREKITQQKKLSPLFLLRDDQNQKTIIADGYHRMCAVHSFDEDALIPCKII